MFIRPFLVVPVLFAISGGLAVAQPNLVAHWDFESCRGGGTTGEPCQGDGSDILEDKASSHDGVVFGSPELVSSQIAGGSHALRFENGKAVKVLNHPDLLPGNHSYTFSAWFKTSVSGVPQTITWTQRNCCGNTSVLAINPVDDTIGYTYHDDRVVCCINPDQVRVTSTDSVTDGRWHHVVAVRDTDASLAFLYVDGVLVDSAPDSPAVVDTTATFGIGHRPSDAIGFDERFFQGLIDEIKIYDNALAEEDVRRLYVAENPQTLSSNGCSIPTDRSQFPYLNLNQIAEILVNRCNGNGGRDFLPGDIPRLFRGPLAGLFRVLDEQGCPPSEPLSAEFDGVNNPAGGYSTAFSSCDVEGQEGECGGAYWIDQPPLACDNHDFCYRSCGAGTKDQCDTQFRTDMDAICDQAQAEADAGREEQIVVDKCRYWAGVYETMVRLGGGSAFNDAREQCLP